MRRKVAWILVGTVTVGACAEPDREEASVDETSLVDAVEIVGEGIISTEANQTFPALDPLTGDLWFSVYEGSFDEQTIMFARRTESGWATPEVAPFSGEWGDRAPRFSPDGATILITSNRPRPGGARSGDMNIWRVERQDSGWSEPELLDSAVNSTASDIHPSVTDDAIWVASNRDGGSGRSDFYRIGADGEVVHPGPTLNDQLSQPDLWVSRDESWMILAITDHPDGHGGDDLYVSRNEGGTWTTPVNLGPDINTDEYEYGPWVSADGEFLFFTSHRAGPSHVYRVSMDVVRDVVDGH
jgi:Tol biopolymer transport system component